MKDVRKEEAFSPIMTRAEKRGGEEAYPAEKPIERYYLINEEDFRIRFDKKLDISISSLFYFRP